jgi:hypothetical protein
MIASHPQNWSLADGSVSRSSLVVVLAEDARHQSLVRRYLYRLGYSQHDIRPVSLPAGRGSGEQWVRGHYAAEVMKFRARSTRAKTALIVVIDADTKEVSERHHQLRDTLKQARSAARVDSEAIVHLIPKRNVETWILCLSGQEVDEVTDYHNERSIDQLIANAGAIFFHWTRPNAALPSNCIPSLSAAIPEARRLER